MQPAPKQRVATAAVHAVLKGSLDQVLSGVAYESVSSALYEAPLEWHAVPLRAGSVLPQLTDTCRRVSNSPRTPCPCQVDPRAIS